MSQRLNWYKADLREIRFRLFEQLKLGELLGEDLFADWGEQEVNMVLDEVYKFVVDKIGPTNGVGDAEGCKLVDGKVKAPSGFKEAWTALTETGYRGVALHPEYDGQGAPFAVGLAVEEMVAGANTAFSMYPGLAAGAAEVIHSFGTARQKKLYAKRMFTGVWGGTMCLTEPQAGSDVGAATSKAVKQADGRYKISGTKIYISGGDHDLTENIVHLVLARTDGAPAGTKGLSLFIVPRERSDEAGTLVGGNDVAVGSIEHKMGINGSSTCVLNFGESDDCYGELVGETECQGISQMFRMMNFARIGVGLQGLAVASSAYQNALAYARDRKQGASYREWKNPEAPRVAIIGHPDVRRMLLEMKSRVEGIRALILKLAVHTDRERVAKAKGDDDAAAYHKGQVDLLVPLVKSYGSDQAFRICELAIQTYGGAGYLKDHPVEQYCRDAKIFSIYEGTNHIQAMDLVGRKLGQKAGANFQKFASDISTFIASQKDGSLGTEVKTLGSAMEALSGTAMRFLGWFNGGKLGQVAANANRFLEMMSETAVAWLLLDGAALAEAKLAKLPEGSDDRAFYLGTIASARYFARNVLPNVAHNAAVIGAEDTTVLDLPDEAFGKAW